MKYKAVVFDLDGTLLNTLDDLADSVNAMLYKNGFPERTKEEVRSFVGNGARNLIAQSVPADTNSEQVDLYLSQYLKHYLGNMRSKTRPYDGVLDVLKGLREMDFKIAVCSNKGDENVKGLCAEYFPGLVDVAIGEVSGMAKKPAPDSVLMAIKDLGADARDTVYVGDSDVDVRTAQNAGLPFIGVSWGFRDKKDLYAEGASVIADTAEELLKYLTSV